MLPRAIEPMEPVAATEVNDDEGWLYQVKWDGVRMLAYLDAGEVMLINRRQNPRTETYPEVASAVARLGLKDAIIDGEIVVIKDGRPSFASVMRRDGVGRPRPDLLTRLPSVYVAFDLLYVDGQCLLDHPLTERMATLRDAVPPGPSLIVTDDYRSGTALLQVMARQKWEGIVAKRRQSRYRPGKHRDWQKIKVRQVALFPVVGWTERDGRTRALLLGVPGDERTVAGKVASGLGADEWSRARERLSADSDRSVIVRTGGERWYIVSSDLAAVVQFQEWTDEVGLRSPVVLSLVTRPSNEGGADEGRESGRDR